MEKQNNQILTNEEETSADKYLAAIEQQNKKIADLQATNKALQDENKSLFNKVMDSDFDSAEGKSEGPTIEELALKLASVDKHPLTNLEYAETQLELRRKLLKAGKRDPFLPSETVQLTANEEAQIKQYVDTLEDCVKQADGDSVAFNILFNNAVADTKSPRR